MKTKPESTPTGESACDLHRDLFADAASRTRRKLRARRGGTALAAVAALSGSFALLALRPDARPPERAAQEEPPAALISSETNRNLAPSSTGTSAPHFATISSDQELLDLLVEQGPILITLPDGRKELILTRPPL